MDENKKASQQQNGEVLWESEERFRKVFECGAIGIVLTCRDFTFKDANPKFCQMIGYTKEELRSMTFLDVTHPDDIESSKTLKVKLQAGQISQFKIEKRYIRKDGKIMWGATTVSIVKSPEGELLYTIALIEDITRQKRAEIEKQELQEKLARSKKMESLGLLSSGIAHDLNNILSVIVAYPDVILMDKTLSEETKNNIEMIRNSGKMAAEVVNDLLTIARGVAIEKKSMDINTVIEEYTRSPEYLKLKELYPTVSINTDLDMELFHIKASSNHIKKILMNLVTNAVEAISDSTGTVTVSTTNELVEIPKRGYMTILPGEYVVLKVIDTGEGISREDIEQIFEPFFTRKVLGRSGSGLGLAVVWNIVHDHGGYIDVKSDSKGTTFKFYFPKTEEQEVARKGKGLYDIYKGDGQSILIIDDEKQQRDMLSNMLEILDYAPKAFSTGEEAIDYLKKNTADLIILDMILSSGMDSRETYEKILELYPDQKAIIASALSCPDGMPETHSSNHGHYIEKPYSLEKISLAVKKELLG
jgi:PAS domain S-box-containing protein